MTATTTARQGIVLFGHGSRDPAWAAPFEAVRARAAADAPHALVRCAYLELTGPDLPAAVADLVAADIARLRVVPLFLGMGRHAREDLPALVDALRATYPELPIEVAPAVGEDPRVIALLAKVALGGPPAT